MKKNIILTSVLCLSILLAACGGGTSAPAPGGSAVSGSAASLQEEAISGNVDNANMNTLTIVTADGFTFTFSTDGAQIDAPADGIMLGDSATVYYTGELDENTQQQNVQVTRTVVQHNT